MLRTSIMVFHVILAALLVGVILVQRGKGAEVGTAFGAGAAGTVFGARGSASFLTRATAVMATLFFLTSLSLAFLSSQPVEQSSIMAPAPQPATPATESLPPPPAAPETEASTPATPSEAGASGQPSEQPATEGESAEQAPATEGEPPPEQ
jgi:preprotein translocase subunit SecG